MDEQSLAVYVVKVITSKNGIQKSVALLVGLSVGSATDTTKYASRDVSPTRPLALFVASLSTQQPLEKQQSMLESSCVSVIHEAEGRRSVSFGLVGR